MTSSVPTPAADGRRAVILVGHGGVPRDFPRDRLLRLKRLESARRSPPSPPTTEELALEAELRGWPRTPDNDPYGAGLERLASRLRPLLAPDRLVLAYNEFCAPTLEQAVATLVADGFESIVVVPSMLTPGGSHSEIDIPEAIEQARGAHPGVSIRYAWPFDLDRIAVMLAEQVSRQQ